MLNSAVSDVAVPSRYKPVEELGRLIETFDPPFENRNSERALDPKARISIRLLPDAAARNIFSVLLISARG
ncbi:hypothetical protein D3C74_399110 [compost metagenome]